MSMDRSFLTYNQDFFLVTLHFFFSIFANEEVRHILAKKSLIMFFSETTLKQFEPILTEIILGCSSFQNISDWSKLHRRWLPLLKIELS